MPASCFSLEVSGDNRMPMNLQREATQFSSYERATPHPEVCEVYESRLCLGSKAPLHSNTIPNNMDEPK